jgi:hypothetical protein
VISLQYYYATRRLTALLKDFVLNLFACENRLVSPGWDKAIEYLGIVSLVFSFLFMLELFASVWAFGWTYFNSYFHCFDAFVIVGGFTIDIVLRGVAEEAASLIIILRLW